MLMKAVQETHEKLLKEIDDCLKAELRAINMEYQRDMVIWVLGPVLFLAGIICASFFH